MQRWCSKLRALSHLATSSTTPKSTLPLSCPSINRFYSPASNLQHTSPFSVMSSQFMAHFNAPTSPLSISRTGSLFSPFYPHYVQMRDFSAKSKEKKWKKLTPATSRVKKIKMKTMPAFKGRFRTLNDGTIRRWREGKSHNAHSKSKKSKRRLRKPEIVPAAYAKVMKKMNFCANY